MADSGGKHRTHRTRLGSQTSLFVRVPVCGDSTHCTFAPSAPGARSESSGGILNIHRGSGEVVDALANALGRGGDAVDVNEPDHALGGAGVEPPLLPGRRCDGAKNGGCGSVGVLALSGPPKLYTLGARDVIALPAALPPPAERCA